MDWSIWDLVRPDFGRSCSDWVVDNIDISQDYTSPESQPGFPLHKRPHLRDPLDFFSREQGGKMSVMAVEQTGKSTIWKLGLIYRTVEFPEPVIIIYPSDEMGQDENRDSLEPLMRTVPSLQQLLETPFATARDCYRLGKAIIHFRGSGSPLISSRAATVIGDEVNSWVVHEGQTDNVKRMDHRTRAYQDARRVLVCSPTGTGGTIWREFKKSSRGFWHLRCRGCGELTIRSCDIAGTYIDEHDERRGGLQFEIDTDDESEYKTSLEESIRLICPRCLREHVESESVEMNQTGAYLHENLKKLDSNAGFQWGALANIPGYFPALSWKVVADAQLSAGSSGTMSDQNDFHNSFRGMPNLKKQGTSEDNDVNAQAIVKRHCAPLPEEKDIWFRVLGVDTQDDCFYWVARGVDRELNTYLLDCGKVDTMDDVKRLMSTSFHGGVPVMGFQDIRGNRQKEIVPLIRGISGLLMYRGVTSGSLNKKGRQYRWNRQSSVSKIYNVDASHYLGEFLYKLYRQLDPSEPGFLYLPPDISEEYIKAVLSYKPNERKKDADHYENWEATNRQEHLADCEKMILACIDITLAQMRKAGQKTPSRPAGNQEDRRPKGQPVSKPARTKPTRNQRVVNRY